MIGGAEAWPPWAWIAIIAIILSGFRSRRWGRHHRYASEESPPAVEREDPRVDELQARVAELENRLDFTERLLAGRDRSASDAPPAGRALS